jgi:hypothetical protein
MFTPQIFVSRRTGVNGAVVETPAATYPLVLL